MTDVGAVVEESREEKRPNSMAKKDLERVDYL